MAQNDALKKYLDAGMAFTHLTRARAEQVVKDLVAAGDLQRNQAKGAIDELLDRSRKNAETLAEQVRKEVDSQLASLGLARKADVERLEAELRDLKGGGGEAKPEPSVAQKPAPAKKAKPAQAKAEPPEKADKAQKAEKPAAATPLSGQLPAKKAAAKGGDGGAKAAPARKAAKVGGQPSPAAGSGSSMPAKKTAKKQG